MPNMQHSPRSSKQHSMSDLNVDNIEKYDKEESTPPTFVFQRQKRGREHGFEEELGEFKMEIKTMITTLLTSQKDELKKIAAAQVEIKQTNNNIETSLTFLAAQNDDLRKKLEQLEVQVKQDKDYILVLEDKIEDLQRDSRKSNIEIKNVPKLTKESKEDLTNMVLNLSKTLNCEAKRDDIKDIYRVQGKKDPNKNTPIVVELSSTTLKANILKSCKIFNVKNKEKLRAKHLGATKHEETAIFVSEQLTAKGARLHFVARDLARSQCFKFCWTAYGRVYLRKDEHSPIILVRSEAQLHNLRNSNPKMFESIPDIEEYSIHSELLLAYSTQSSHAAYEVLQIECSTTIDENVTYELKTGDSARIVPGSSQYVNALCTRLGDDLDISSLLDKVHGDVEACMMRKQKPIKVQCGVAKRSLYDPVKGEVATLLSKLKAVTGDIENCVVF